MSGIQQMMMASHAPAGGAPFGGLVSTANLVEWWPLDEASGTRVGVHAGLDLTDNNTVTGNPGVGSSTASQFTRANNEFLSRASSAALQTGDIAFTACKWVYLDSKPAAGYSTLLGKNDYSASQYEWSIMHQTSIDRFLFSGCSDGVTNFGTCVANSFGAPSLSTWHFVVCWHDPVANTMNIQINDGSVDSLSWTAGLFSGTGDFTIGEQKGLSRQLDGRGQRAGFWKRILTAGEKTALFNSGNGLDY